METKVGPFIRTLRKEKKLTLMDVSNKTGISFTQIGKIERGLHHPTRETVEKIANALSFDQETLLNMAGYASVINYEIIKVKHPETDNKYSEITVYKNIDPDIKYSTLIRYDRTCQLCGAKAPSTEIVIAVINPEYNITEENLITLCSDCNISRNKLIRDNGLQKDYLINQKRINY